MKPSKTILLPIKFRYFILLYWLPQFEFLLVSPILGLFSTFLIVIWLTTYTKGGFTISFLVYLLKTLPGYRSYSPMNDFLEIKKKLQPLMRPVKFHPITFLTLELFLIFTEKPF